MFLYSFVLKDLLTFFEHQIANEYVYLKAEF